MGSFSMGLKLINQLLNIGTPVNVFSLTQFFNIFFFHTAGINAPSILNPHVSSFAKSVLGP